MATKQMDHAAYMKKVRGMSEEALRFTIRDAQAAMEANPHNDNNGYYADEVSYCAMELERRAGDRKAGKPREAYAIDDLADLFGDYAVEVQLTDGPDVYLQMPPVEEYAARYSAKTCADTHLAEKFGTGYQPQSLAFAHMTKARIADLLATPQFWRVTTVAHVVGAWARRQAQYGPIKCRKEGGQPFTMIFESIDTARRFFEDLTRACEQQQ